MYHERENGKYFFQEIFPFLILLVTYERETHSSELNLEPSGTEKRLLNFCLIFVEFCGRLLATAVCQIRHTSRTESLLKKCIIV